MCGLHTRSHDTCDGAWSGQPPYPLLPLLPLLTPCRTSPRRRGYAATVLPQPQLLLVLCAVVDVQCTVPSRTLATSGQRCPGSGSRPRSSSRRPAPPPRPSLRSHRHRRPRRSGRPDVTRSRTQRPRRRRSSGACRPVVPAGSPPLCVWAPVIGSWAGHWPSSTSTAH